MIGSGTPSIQSNMPRPIGSLLLRLLSRDLQTISMFISSSENSKKPLVLLRFFTGNSSRGGREVRTWAFGSEQKPYRPDFRLFIPWHDDQHVAGQWLLNVTRLVPGSRHPAGRRDVSWLLYKDRTSISLVSTSRAFVRRRQCGFVRHCVQKLQPKAAPRSLARSIAAASPERTGSATRERADPTESSHRE